MSDNSFCPKDLHFLLQGHRRSSLEGKIKKLIFIPSGLISTKADTA